MRARRTARRPPECTCYAALTRPCVSRLAGIEDLRDKREEINRQILKEDEEKAKARAEAQPRSANRNTRAPALRCGAARRLGRAAALRTLAPRHRVARAPHAPAAPCGLRSATACRAPSARLAAAADARPRLPPQIQNDLAVLTKRLSHLNDSIARKVASRSEYDKTIAETEAAYLKILESSQTLLTVLKRETVTCVTPPVPGRLRFGSRVALASHVCAALQLAR